MNKTCKIVITGAESTGKTELAKQLARHYKTVYVPEYAREFVEKSNNKYNYNDILNIAEKQIELVNKYLKKAKAFLFIDTYLVIIKIWLLWCYKKYPEWIDEYLKKDDIDLYLICNNDLPWFPDKVRENPGENREKLYNEYLRELQILNKNFVIIKGEGEERLLNAINAIELFFK